MQKKDELRRALDSAIDRGELAAIESSLEALMAQEADTIRAEDPRLFAARLQKMQMNKERLSMNQPRKWMTAAVVAAAVLVMGATAFAAVQLNWFTFADGERFVSVRTNQNISEQEAREIIDSDTEMPEDVDPEMMAQPEVKELTFATVEEARAQMDMQVPLPGSLPEMDLASADGTITRFGEDLERRTLWLNYTDDKGRIFGVTISREVYLSGQEMFGYTSSDMDEGSAGQYVSKAGDVYTTLTESNETGDMTAHIATIMQGEYEYALVFVGFEDAERAALIDSVDISVLK